MAGEVEKDFSFGSRAYAGNRWVLAGDAGSFLDPVFSTGVAIALESGLEAAEAVDRGLTHGDLSVRQFVRFARRQRRRYRAFRRFVVSFYTPEFRDLFFDRQPPTRMFRAMGDRVRRLLATVDYGTFVGRALLPAGPAQARVRFARPLVSNRPEVAGSPRS